MEQPNLTFLSGVLAHMALHMRFSRRDRCRPASWRTSTAITCLKKLGEGEATPEIKFCDPQIKYRWGVRFWLGFTFIQIEAGSPRRRLMKCAVGIVKGGRELALCKYANTYLFLERCFVGQHVGKSLKGIQYTNG